MEQLEQLMMTVFLLFIGWFYLLYRFHVALEIVDPELSQKIGKPSIVWTAYNGHRILINLARRRDLINGPYASLAMLAMMVRLWAYALVGAMVWLVYRYAELSGLL